MSAIQENECGLIWEEGEQNSDVELRSALVGKKVYDMKCGRCFTFIESASKPSEVESNYCHGCGRKIRKEEEIYSK